MPLPTWPNTLPDPAVGMSEDVYFPALRTEFESGTVQSRRRSTKERGKFSLSWAALYETEYQTLRTFFIANQGGTFTWVHPVSSVSYTCRFSGDSLSSKHLGSGLRSVELAIEEK